MRAKSFDPLAFMRGERDAASGATQPHDPSTGQFTGDGGGARPATGPGSAIGDEAIARVVKRFGTTTNWRTAGFILPDGRMIEMGRDRPRDSAWNTPGGPIEHAAVALAAMGIEGSSDGMNGSEQDRVVGQFMRRTGALRFHGGTAPDWGGTTPVAHVTGSLTDRQLSALDRVLSDRRAELSAHSGGRPQHALELQLPSGTLVSIDTPAELRSALAGKVQRSLVAAFREFDESRHPRDASGKFTDAGGGAAAGADVPVGDPKEWGGKITVQGLGESQFLNGLFPRAFAIYDKDPNGYIDRMVTQMGMSRERAEWVMSDENRAGAAAIVRVRDELGRWDEQTQSAISGVHVLWPTTVQEIAGTLASTIPLSAYGGDDRRVAIQLDPVVFYDKVAEKFSERQRAGRANDEMSARWVINHEVAHAFLTARAGSKPDDREAYLRAHGFNEKVMGEIAGITSYGMRSGFEERFAEAVGLYMATGKVRGPASARMLLRLGIAKRGGR